MRGGKREKAGRKPRATPRKAVTIRLEQADADKFAAICRANGNSQAKQLAIWIKRQTDENTGGI